MTAQQTIAVVKPMTSNSTQPAPQNLWVDVRVTAGKWLAQGQVIVK